MGRKDYPALGESRDRRKAWSRNTGAIDPKLHPCVTCGQAAGWSIWVQVSFLRGDDEGPFDVCAEHRKPDAQTLLQQLPKMLAAKAARREEQLRRESINRAKRLARKEANNAPR